MGEVISLTEASRRYNIGEKTLRKWIRAAGLAEKKPNDQKRMTWEIDTDALERLIREKRTGTPSVDMPVHATSGQGVQVSDLSREQITELAMQLSYQGEILEAMKQELEDLRNRVTTLEQDHTVPQPARSTPSTWPVEARVPHAVSGSRSKSDKQPLPDGWYSWNNFLTRHKLRPQSFEKDGYVQTGEYVSGRASVKDALDPSGQARFVQDYRGRITECDVDACPCHQGKQETLW